MDTPAKVKIHFNRNGSHPGLKTDKNPTGSFAAMTTESVDAAVAKYLVETKNDAAYVSEKVAAEAAAEVGATVDVTPVKKR